MAQQPKRLKYVKFVTAKGHRYAYFDTGVIDEAGKRVYAKLPSPNDPTFYNAYGAMLGHRTRRANTASELTVTKLVEMYWLSDNFKSKAPATRRNYELYQGYFVKMLPTAPAGRVERTDIIKMLDERGATPGAANALLSAIAAVYSWARYRGHVTNEPTKNIDYMDMGEHEPWPDHVLEAALKAKDDRVRLASHLLYFTAQRISDVTNMRWSDIRDGVIYTTQMKTNIAVEIPIHRDLKTELDRQKRTSLTIIPGVGARALNTVTLRTSLQKFAAKMGHKVVPHGLRKNAINALLEVGCTVPQVSSISGQTMQTVEHYAKRRSQKKLGRAAILIWEEQTANVQTSGKPARKR